MVKRKGFLMPLDEALDDEDEFGDGHPPCLDDLDAAEIKRLLGIKLTSCKTVGDTWWDSLSICTAVELIWADGTVVLVSILSLCPQGFADFAYGWACPEALEGARGMVETELKDALAGKPFADLYYGRKEKEGGGACG